MQQFVTLEARQTGQMQDVDETMQRFLARGLHESQQAQQMPQAQYTQQVDVAKGPIHSMTYESEVYEFDANVEQVDYIINEKWEKLSDARQYNKAWGATELVNKEITKIVQSITDESHYETKINALLALSNIGTIVAIGGGRLGAEVRKHVGYDDGLVNVMLDITDLMTVNEQRALSSDDMQALEEFDKERKGYCVFDGFENVLDVFKKAKMEPSIVVNDEHDDDDYGDIDEQALLNKSDANEGWASQPITI